MGVRREERMTTSVGALARTEERPFGRTPIVIDLVIGGFG